MNKKWRKHRMKAYFVLSVGLFAALILAHLMFLRRNGAQWPSGAGGGFVDTRGVNVKEGMKGE